MMMETVRFVSLSGFVPFICKALVSRTSPSTLGVGPSRLKTLISTFPVSGPYFFTIFSASVLSLKTCDSGSRKEETTKTFIVHH